MKIAIISLPLHTNYGGILQSYALSHILKERDHEVHVISRPVRYRYSFRNIIASLKRSLLSFVKGNGLSFFQERSWNKGAELIETNTKVFIEKYITTDSRPISDIGKNDYDAFIVGSDQVWRPFYFSMHQSNIRNAFLGFAKGWRVKRLAYAASFGTDNWEFSEKETNDIIELVKDFDLISVREISGVELCQDHLNVNAVHTLDPTLLLCKDDYLSLIDNIGVENRKDKMLVYVLDKNDEKQHLINVIANTKKIEPLYVGRADDHEKLAEDRIQPPVEEWLACFRDVEFVITDSFHACIFSILFHKPFIVVANKERGYTRFTSLLGQFNLIDHLLLSQSDYNPRHSYEIPVETYQILDNLREKSIAIIDEFLNK